MFRYFRKSPVASLCMEEDESSNPKCKHPSTQVSESNSFYVYLLFFRPLCCPKPCSFVKGHITQQIDILKEIGKEKRGGGEGRGGEGGKDKVFLQTMIGTI